MFLDMRDRKEETTPAVADRVGGVNVLQDPLRKTGLNLEAGADGTTIDGKAYVDLSGLLGNGQLDPGETISKRIYFNNPNRVQFTFEPSVRGIILP